MDLTEDRKIHKNARKCLNCMRKKLIPYESELTCIACGYNVIKRKNELCKTSRNEIFIYRLKYAQQKNFVLYRCI